MRNFLAHRPGGAPGRRQNVPPFSRKTFAWFHEPKRAANVFHHTIEMRGYAMKCCNEIVPLAVMGSLSAAIMVVFAVTVMH
jgi:hypothetical protein